MKINCWEFNQHQMPTHLCFFSRRYLLSQDQLFGIQSTPNAYTTSTVGDSIQPTPTVVDTCSLKIIVSETDNARSLHLSQRQLSHKTCVDVFNDMSLARSKIECCKDFTTEGQTRISLASSPRSAQSAVYRRPRQDTSTLKRRQELGKCSPSHAHCHLQAAKNHVQPSASCNE